MRRQLGLGRFVLVGAWFLSGGCGGRSATWDDYPPTGTGDAAVVRFDAGGRRDAGGGRVDGGFIGEDAGPGRVDAAVVGCRTNRECDDGIGCNGAETCGFGADGARVCQAATPITCDDGNPCTADTCVEPGMCRRRSVDADGDGDRPVMCGGSDCDDSNPAVSGSRGERCGDGLDNDCNGAADCADPRCAMTPDCGTTMCHVDARLSGDAVSLVSFPVPSRVDGVTCGTFPGNDFIAAWVPATSGMFTIRVARSSGFGFGVAYDTCPTGALVCGGGGPGPASTTVNVAARAGQTVYLVVDGLTDRSNVIDELTIMRRGTTMGPETACADRMDNDGDGAIDCADTDCLMNPSCLMDPGCTMQELGVAACTNGRDDDCDGRSDCADTDCTPFGPGGECCNGRDDTGDGNIDEFTCRCSSNDQCVGVGSLDQVCWTTDYSVCAPRCNFVGGDAFCRMFFMGTRCNRMTGECG